MMKKEEILAISKREGLDERVEIIETDSSSYGLITVLALVLFFSVWKLIHGVKCYELGSIFTGYLASTSFYKFKKLQSNKFLIGGIFATLGAIAAAIAFTLGA